MQEEWLKISRKDLYKLVWEVPISRLSPKYGLSDVGLAKVCKRLNVPRPGRGFWARKKKGCSVTIPPLPPLKIGQLTEVLMKHSAKPPPLESMSPELKAIITFEGLAENRISVPDGLAIPNPLVKETKRILKGIKPDDYGRIRPWKEPCLDICVSAGNLDRALRIMNSIIVSLAKRECEVIAEKNGNEQRTSAIVLEEKVHFGIEESSRRVEKVLTAKEKRERDRWPSLYSSTPYVHIPSGLLTLRIKNWVNGTFRKSWTDGKKQCLEDCLNDFIISLHRIALVEKENRRAREERQRLWEEEKRRKEEEENLRREEQRKIQYLEHQVNNWFKSQQIRSYLNAVKEAAVCKYGRIEAGSKLDKWLTWASSYADQIDPLFNDNEVKLNIRL